jgi:hypothetical protein
MSATSTPERRTVEVSRRISEGMLRAQATGIYDLALYARSDEPEIRERYETAKLAADQFDQAASTYIKAGTGLEAMQQAWKRFLAVSRYDGSP